MDGKFFDDEFFDALDAVPPLESAESDEDEDEVPEEVQQPAVVVKSCVSNLASLKDHVYISSLFLLGHRAISELFQRCGAPVVSGDVEIACATASLSTSSLRKRTEEGPSLHYGAKRRNNYTRGKNHSRLRLGLHLLRYDLGSGQPHPRTWCLVLHAYHTHDDAPWSQQHYVLPSLSSVVERCTGYRPPRLLVRSHRSAGMDRSTNQVGLSSLIITRNNDDPLGLNI